MEKNMSCVLVNAALYAGRYYVCKDGLVFTYEQIRKHPNIWE
jgi:hypothetical protein